MAVQCPNCGFGMELKGARPGRFAPKCQGCGEKFVLIISSDPNVAPVAQRSKSETVSPAIATGLGMNATPGNVVKQTMPPPGMTAPPPVGPIENGPARNRNSDSLSAAIRAAEMAMDDAEDPPPGPHRPQPAAMQTAPPAPAPAAKLAATVGREKPRPAADGALLDPALRDMELAGKLGGYDIIEKLGQGGMGAVYLARQVSLDRNVAVKVLKPELAQDATFIARFTREAFAAAQLTHHNIVQIHDLGEEGDIHYFSMEFVEGHTLGDTVKRNGRLDIEAAVGYVLQAARGLKFAHDHAMIHRDIKPDNLLLNSQGIVKVADLGLVKRQGISDVTASPALAAASDASVTRANLSMGTPSYMAPEQAKDAAKVDMRADIYSLGCTLYDLLTGRPPFLGKTAVEVITKHSTEKVVPPEKLVKEVPAALSVILLKMMAKKPEDRYASMDDVIRVLEEYLGTAGGGSGPFAPREEHAKVLERAVNEYNAANWARIRKLSIAGFFAACGLTALYAMWGISRGGEDVIKYVQIAGGAVGLMILSFVSYIILTGITHPTYLTRRVRQYIFSAPWTDWAKALLFLCVLVGILMLFHLQWVWLGFLIAAVVLTAAFHFVVDLMVAGQRKVSVDQVELMMKQMRMRGLDEDALRQFICKYSGNRWEEFYEALFGYEDKRVARQRWGIGTRGRNRKKWGAWRDALLDWIDARMRQKREERELALLTKVEERKMRAQNVPQAKAKARRLAKNVAAKADRMRESIRESAMRPKSMSGEPEITRMPVQSLLDDDPVDDDVVHRKHETYIQRKYGSIWGLLLGAQVRFLVGVGMLAGFLLWMYMSNPTFLQDLGRKSVQVSSQTMDKATGEDKYQTEPAQQIDVNLITPTKALDISSGPVPPKTREKILSVIGSYQGGLAGLILVISGFFRGLKMGVYMVAATGLILLCGGDQRLIQLPTMGLQVNATHVAMVLGTGIAVMAFLFGRED